jgi:hypothetical protein
LEPAPAVGAVVPTVAWVVFRTVAPHAMMHPIALLRLALRGKDGAYKPKDQNQSDNES